MSLTVAQLARLQRWEIEVSGPVDQHPFAWWGRRGGVHVVVKAGDAGERSREVRALRAFGARSADVVVHDRDLGLLVTERVLPGDDIRPLARRDDDAATLEIARLAADLHRDQSMGDGLPPLADIGAAFRQAHDERLPRELVVAARTVFDELIGDATPQVVLHGDLHHLNVLNAGDEWRAIDPHGWWGDPSFEAAAMLANPRGLVEGGDARGMDGRDLARRSRRRAAIYAEVTGYDRQRLLDWGFVGCVIAELWMIEAHDLVHGAPLAVAEALVRADLC